MSPANRPSPTPQTQTVPRDQWNIFLTAFTRENRGAHARLEVVGGETKYQVETENKPFDGISVDFKDRECTVWIVLGQTAADHVSHGISNATALRVIPPAGGRGATLEVESEDRTKTILEMSNPADFALPSPQLKAS